MNKIRIGILHHSFVWTTKFNRERVEVKKINDPVTQWQSHTNEVNNREFDYTDRKLKSFPS